MKAFLEKIGLALTILICLPFFVSCTGSENEQYVKTNSEKISVNDNINNMANLHSIALDCAVEIAEEYRMSTTNLTTEQLYYVVTESAVLNGVKKYVNQKENRTLSSTEENTLKKEVNNYWNDSSTRNLINKLSTESAINSLNPTTGSADLKIFYKI